MSEKESAMDLLMGLADKEESKDSANSVIRVGDPNALEKFYAKLADKYNLDELKDILECEENMLIDSGAGSGKTTTLLLKILRDILAGNLVIEQTDKFGNVFYTIKPVLVCTFLRSGAEDIQTKFVKLIKDFNIVGISVGNIVFRTIHAEVHSALTAMGVDLNIVTDASKYLRQACQDYNIQSVLSKSRVLTNEELNDILSIVTYARNRLDNTRFRHPLMQEYRMSEIDLKGILDKFSIYKQLDGVKDFEDMEEMLLEGMKTNQKVFYFCASRYRYVYIDEFQDTSQLQYALLTPYLKGAENFIAIGDEDQSIYSFRGSDVGLIQKRFEEDYKPVLKQLTVNRRCNENILTPILTSIEMNTQRHKKDLTAGNPGGEVKIVVDDDINYLLKNVKNDLNSGMRNIGIIGRTNADLLIPTMLLLSGNMNFTVSKSVSLSERIPKQVLGVMNLITERYNMNFEGYFKAFLSRSNVKEAEKLCQILATSPEKSIYNLPLEDIQFSSPNLYPLISMLRTEVPVDPVGAYLEMLNMLEHDVYNSKTVWSQRARDFIYYIRKLIKEHDYFKGKSIEELSYIFFKVIPKILDDKKITEVKSRKKKKEFEEVNRPDNAPIRISTVHDAKGKEWDSVYIWNDVYGSFPNSVGTRELTPEEFEEERRVHYIAWTRAIKKLVVFTRSDAEKGFLQECDLTGDNVEVIYKDAEKSKLNFDTQVETVNKVHKTKVADYENSRIKIDGSCPSAKDIHWKDYIEKYVIKYMATDKILTREGKNLDMCLTRLGGIDGIRSYLDSVGLTKYPADMIEEVISDTLESYLINN